MHPGAHSMKRSHQPQAYGLYGAVQFAGGGNLGTCCVETATSSADMLGSLTSITRSRRMRMKLRGGGGEGVEEVCV